MQRNIKMLLIAVSLTAILAGCGSQSTTQNDIESASFNSSNYIEIAQDIYASPEKLTKALPPQAEIDSHTLYLSKIVKPRELEITELEVIEGEQRLSITIDYERKYATVTLNKGTEYEEEQVVNFKDFTASQE